MKIFKKKNKCKEELLNSYPCDHYLSNALYFIERGATNIAYTEVCCAILKSGGELTDAQLKRYRELKRRENDVE
jgi:hypothetical protein